MLLSDVVLYVHLTETHLFVCLSVMHNQTHTYLSFYLIHLSALLSVLKCDAF